MKRDLNEIEANNAIIAIANTLYSYPVGDATLIPTFEMYEVKRERHKARGIPARQPGHISK